MHTINFATRNAARAFPVGKLVDNGPDAPKGARYGRAIAGLSGSARQRRKTLREMKRNASH